MSEPVVSVIVLNYNSAEYIFTCLEHVRTQTYRNVEVIVIDNASRDGSLERLRNIEEEFLLIENAVNTGFSGGMNQGIRACAGEYVIPLNADVFLQPDFIAEAVVRMERRSDLGAIGGLIFSAPGGKKSEEPRRGESGGFFLRRRFQGMGNPDLERECEVFGPPGSCPFLRREALDDVEAATGDLYDERYFVGGEDIDLYFRLQLLGWRALFSPSLRAWHVGSGSAAGRDTLIEKSLDYQARVLRNRYLTMIKDLPCDLFRRLAPGILLAEVLMWPYFLIRSPRTLRAILCAWKETLVNGRETLRKRHQVQKAARIDGVELKRFFLSY